MEFSYLYKMKTATIKIDFFDENGNAQTSTFTVDYDATIQNVITSVEYLPSNVGGGPTMRPKKPR
jgi:hypothetical protein